MGVRKRPFATNHTGVDMKGHEAVIAMRQSGRKPGFIFINDYPCATDWERFDDYATVSIDPKEQPEWLDLRFLIDCRVSVSSTSEKRAQGLFEACKAANVSLVAAGVVQPEARYNQTGWVGVWQK